MNENEKGYNTTYFRPKVTEYLPKKHEDYMERMCN